MIAIICIKQRTCLRWSHRQQWRLVGVTWTHRRVHRISRRTRVLLLCPNIDKERKSLCQATTDEFVQQIVEVAGKEYEHYYSFIEGQ